MCIYAAPFDSFIISTREESVAEEKNFFGLERKEVLDILDTERLIYSLAGDIYRSKSPDYHLMFWKKCL